MHEVLNWLVTTIGALGYPGIVILMAMESSIIPVPSELVMAPAGYLAHQGKMDLFVVILLGTTGSLIGSYVNYFISQHLGRPLILRYGRYVFITPHKLERIERYFEEHGEISVFVCRLIPVARHLISIPAGLARMDHLRFTIYTILGAGLWTTVLSYIGYFIGAERELIMKYSHQALLCALGFCAVLVTVYVWRYRVKAAGIQVADPE